MWIDISFFDDAVPTSSLTKPRGAAVAAAALTAVEEEDERGRDVTDFASVVNKLRKITSYRCVVFTRMMLC